MPVTAAENRILNPSVGEDLLQPRLGEDGIGDVDPEGATVSGSCTGPVSTAMPASLASLG